MRVNEEKNFIVRLNNYMGLSLVACKSTNIIGYGYKGTDLYVLFKGHKLYKYPYISKEKFWELDSSHSKGRWVNDNLVKTKAPYEFINTEGV